MAVFVFCRNFGILIYFILFFADVLSAADAYKKVIRIMDMCHKCQKVYTNLSSIAG